MKEYLPTFNQKHIRPQSYSLSVLTLLFVTLQIIIFSSEIVTASGLGSLSVEPSSLKYVGAEVCKTCHIEIYENWRKSGHAAILRRPDQDTLDTLSLPNAIKPEDISYVIGGYRWKALYLDREGFFITSGPESTDSNQNSVQRNNWSDYVPGEQTSYTCGRCHTTGFSSAGNQDGMLGVQGSWELDGVQCEACHGPGSKHVGSGGVAGIPATEGVCNRCHQRDPVDVIPVEGIFLVPYTEVNQLNQSGMAHLECIDCHDPHRAVNESVRAACESCHQTTWNTYVGSFKYRLGMECVDCHMPPAGMVAIGNETIFEGDLKSHLFRIDHHADLPIEVSDGQRFNTGYLSVEYVCNRCHNLFEDREWAVRYGTNVHNIQTTTNIKIFNVQRGFMFTGFLFATLALLSGLGLKNIIPLRAGKKILVDIHKHSAWVTFAAYVAVATTCIYFHTPLNNPNKLLGTGWFILHPLAGLTAFFLYGAKIWVVRVRHTGWKMSGQVLGIALFLFWLVQLVTVIAK